MKKLLFATAFASTALASSMGCNTDTLTGLHFGLGVSVLFDKYEADVAVGTNVPYGKVVTGINNFTVGNTTDDAHATKENVVKFIENVWNMVPALAIEKENSSFTDRVQSNHPSLTASDGSTKLYEYKITNDKPNYYALRSLFVQNHTFKKRTTNCGGEIKLAYFHDFGNHLMIGVDLTGVIASKNKKTVQAMPVMAIYPEKLSIQSVGGSIKNSSGDDANWIYNTTTNAVSGVADSDILTVVATTGVLSISTTPKELVDLNRNNGVILDSVAYDSGTKGDADASFNEMALVAAQYKQYDTNTNEWVDVKDPAELTFEKSVFNPRLAFIVGGTVYGWFAGLRLGMSYTTGKVYATGGKLTGQGTQSKTVSISSPLIGLHLMKQLKIAGNNDAHLYLTADWNIGDGRRSVYMNGVRNFRQTGYNISAGVTWRFKLGN